MKARHIRKLRKKIANFREFTVSTTWNLFGNFDCGGKRQRKVYADTPRVAVKRYFAWYKRKYKEMHEQSNSLLLATTYRWGKIMVLDSNGYRYYFE